MTDNIFYVVVVVNIDFTNNMQNLLRMTELV
jgi:hypothetical protein